MTKSPEKCFITDAITTDKPSSVDSVEYRVNFYGKICDFSFSFNHENSKFVNENKHILKGLILNEKFPFNKRSSYFDNESLEKIIKEAYVPKLPKQKMDNLLLFLASGKEFDGKRIDFFEKMEHEELIYKLYFKHHNEYWFYLKSLKEFGYLSFIDATTKYGDDGVNIQITFKGLEYLISIQENGDSSKNCFVAMSFSDSVNDIRKAIKESITECGYNPILIDELNYESEITINDAIIRYIKKSKFLIADFTEQKHGVYFEAGYALGKQKPVIYLCRKDYFSKTHFDTNHYPHIIYENCGELKSQLIDKIKAWIE